MKTKTAAKNTTTKLAEISCHAPEAQAVFVAGTFNNWSPDATPLTLQDDGHWQIKLPLSPGHHEFKFIVDGNWCCEPGCDDKPHNGCAKCVPNEWGTMNRVLEVS